MTTHVPPGGGPNVFATGGVRGGGASTTSAVPPRGKRKARASRRGPALLSQAPMARQRGNFNPAPMVNLALLVVGLLAAGGIALLAWTWPSLRHSDNFGAGFAWFIGVMLVLFLLVAFAVVAWVRWGS